MKIKSFKPVLKLSVIPPLRLCLGIAAGLVVAGVFYTLLLLVHLPIGYVFRGLGYRYLLPDSQQTVNFFFWGFSLCLGQAVCLGLWVSSMPEGSSVRKRLILTTLSWLCWIMLMLLGRYGMLYHAFLSDVLDSGGWDSIMPLLQLISVLLPLVFFFILWNPVLYAYRAKGLFGAALLCWCAGTTLMSFIRPFSHMPQSPHHFHDPMHKEEEIILLPEKDLLEE